MDFFSSLKYAKRRYPMIVTYTSRHLAKLSDDEKVKEVDQFKRFLVSNQSISNKEFDNHDFKTGKPSLTLSMNNFINGVESETFWENINKVEKLLFPNGKPIEMAPSTNENNIASAFGNNPVLMDVIDQMKEMGDLSDISDVSTLMAKPGFQQMVNNIKKKLQTGKYNLKDIISTVTTVINNVDDSLDDETRETLKVVTDTMGAVERNEQVDINNLMNVVSKLKLDGLSK